MDRYCVRAAIQDERQQKLGEEDNHETTYIEELGEGIGRMFYACTVDGRNSQLCDGAARYGFCCTLSSCDGGCLGHLQIVLHRELPEREC